MEKEQKKLLLVAVSTGVFLLVTITVAIIMLTPKIQPQDAVFSSAAPFQAGTIKPVETVSDTSSQPVINNSQETKIYIDGTPDPITIDKNNGDSLTIQIPRPSTPAVPDSPDVPVSSAARTQTPAAATVKPVSTQQPTIVQTTAVIQPASTAASPGKTTAKTITDYWIQTGAFSAMVRAEDVKETLLSKGLTSIIENRNIDGKTLYRVRLGPYTSENEAKYWLALVQSIDGFNDSQVRQTTRQQ